MTNKDFQAELTEKIKTGVKPSDLKKSKSTPPSARSFNQEKYLSELETEKASLLEQVANYVKEQQLAVTAFKQKVNLLEQKEQQLADKDQLITQKEEVITNLKIRIHQLAKNKPAKPLPSEAIITTNAGTQTTGTNPQELEEQLLEKRWQNLENNDNYREKLQAQEITINQLNNQLTLYQAKIRKLILQPNNNKVVIILLILLIITTTLLIFK